MDHDYGLGKIEGMRERLPNRRVNQPLRVGIVELIEYLFRRLHLATSRRINLVGAPAGKTLEGVKDEDARNRCR